MVHRSAPALAACKLALGPLLLWQDGRTRRMALRLPEATGDRAGTVLHAAGAAPVRLLVLGASSAALLTASPAPT